MGCNTSKPKDRTTTDHSDDKASAFLNLANVEKSPVAQELLKSWKLFVDSQSKRIASGNTTEERSTVDPTEVWANTKSEPLTHHSVDQVGKAFLEYVKTDLSQRGWGGNFDYKVVGVAAQGFLRASANIETGYSERPEEVAWAVKICYYSSGAS